MSGAGHRDDAVHAGGVHDPATRLAADVRSGRRRAVDVVNATLDAIDRENPRVNAIVQTLRERALRCAADVDARVARGEDLPLAGVPVAIKDNLCTGPDGRTPGDGLGPGGFTTCASRFLEHYQSPFTATCAQRLLDAGAIVVGKANLDEFAMGSSTERSIFGPTRNPHDPTRVPGGSSGGSAAAVALGVVPLALGSDTGGSIRQPASHCGVVGLKPTYGRVSRFGLVAYASSLDQVGPLTRSVRDAALALAVIAGPDPRDATSDARPVGDLLADLDTPLAGLRVGVVRQARGAGVSAEVALAYATAAERLAPDPAARVEIDLPSIDHAIAAYYIVATAEASSNLARFDGVRYGRRAALSPGDGLEDLYRASRTEGFGPEVRRRILLGTHVLSAGYADAYYTTALKVRRRVLEEFNGAFERCDVVLMPAAPGPAFRAGEKINDPLAMYLEDVFTVGVNLAGLPAICVPVAGPGAGGSVAGPTASDAGLPIGVQIIAPAFQESRLLRAAAMLERAMRG
ncbi:MAG: Asp-tRNA(Asn)/Glu-tRNA(Gln) amidotransferase subunit GatA [Planctomycetota bacterium]|nr:Asp-tRNA(Asn)/Glu-tRNA(Gln) amidotransferase subunit GatA [Planctomycetota bacterium]